MAERLELLSYGWDYWSRLVLFELKKAHPEVERYIERMDIWKWGHPMRQTWVGTIFGKTRQQMQTPHGRIFFGHADVSAIPVFEEVVERGAQIAEEIMKADSA